MKTFRVASSLLALACALPAGATSYVMVSDEKLLADSTAVVTGRITARQEISFYGRATTDYVLDVDRVLAGRVTAPRVVVRVPGGRTASGRTLAIHGAPIFANGDQVTLFLTDRPDGDYAVTHLMLGAFHQRGTGDDAVLLRDLAGARELGGVEGSAAAHRPRSRRAFHHWIARRGRVEPAPADYFVDAPGGGLDREHGEFRLFASRFGNLRWFAFDEGRTVDWRMQTGGAPGFSEFFSGLHLGTAMAAWNDAPGTEIGYQYTGTTTTSRGFSTPDGVNAVIFDNADGSHDTPFSCPGGGVLALGGPWFDSRRAEDGPHGQRYHRIVEGEVILNSGVGCFIDQEHELLQLFAHELGHALGFHHPCDAPGCSALERDALMYEFFHSDGRGPRLNSDDRAAAAYLYPGEEIVAEGIPTLGTWSLLALALLLGAAAFIRLRRLQGDS